MLRNNPMIPKIIWTIWISDKPTPPDIQKWIDSQSIPGYEHRLVTLETADRSFRYVQEALDSKKYAKAADFLRAQYLLRDGGIHLDADIEMLPGKTLDDLLDNKMFICREEGGILNTAAMGAEPNHEIFYQFVNLCNSNFRGDGTWIWEPGLKFFNDLYLSQGPAHPEWNIKILPHDYFFPYEWRTKQLNITDNTRAIHHFLGSWVNG